MKIKLLVCRRCGHEQKVEIYDSEEAKRKNIRVAPPRCEKCGSSDVELHD